MRVRFSLILIGLLQFWYVVQTKPSWISGEMSFLILNLYIMAAFIAGRRRPWWAMGHRKWMQGGKGWGGPMYGGRGGRCGCGPDCRCGGSCDCCGEGQGGHKHGHAHVHNEEPIEGGPAH